MIFQQFYLVNRLDVLTNVLLGRLSYHWTLPTLLKRFTAAERALALRRYSGLISCRRPCSVPKRSQAGSSSASPLPAPWFKGLTSFWPTNRSPR